MVPTNIAALAEALFVEFKDKTESRSYKELCDDGKAGRFENAAFRTADRIRTMGFWVDRCHDTSTVELTPNQLKLAANLHFTMDMDEDHAGCPFSSEDSAEDARTSLISSTQNWKTFCGLMRKIGKPIPKDFHWNDHTDLLD